MSETVTDELAIYATIDKLEQYRLLPEYQREIKYLSPNLRLLMSKQPNNCALCGLYMGEDPPDCPQCPLCGISCCSKTDDLSLINNLVMLYGRWGWIEQNRKKPKG